LDLGERMPLMSHALTNLRIPDTARAAPAARPAVRPRKVVSEFLFDKMEKVSRAGLGRFFGVAPPPSKERLDALREQARKANADDPETQQAKDIYQSMLDITGH